MTRALGLQWSCPVLGMEFHRSGELDGADAAAVRGRLRGAAAARGGGQDSSIWDLRIVSDPVLALAVERMTGLQVESGLVPESIFRPAHARLLRARSFPRRN